MSPARSGTTDAYRARIGSDGESFEVPHDLPVLIAAEQAGIDMASSCRNGTCRTCIRQLDSGRVSYRIQWPGLSADEKEEGWILPCVAYAVTDLVLRPD